MVECDRFDADPLRGSAAGLAKGDEPVTAGLAPRPVIRGESSPRAPTTVHPFAAFTDYLTVTFARPLGDDAFRAWVLDLRAFTGDAMGSLVDQQRGMLGFKRSFAFERFGGHVAFGGQAGRAMLRLPGQACASVRDWPGLAAWLAALPGSRITRWDGAVDVFDGRPDVDQAVRWYREGGFSTGGNRPTCQQQGNWLTPDTRGRTFCVGRRQNGKYLRVYEKGKQLGEADSPWVRFELELHNKDRVIPFDVLTTPGPYVAGAYACLDWISAEAFRVRTLNEERRIGYAAAVHWARRSYGRLINVMQDVEGDAAAVVARLRRPGAPDRLDLPDVPDGEGLRP